mgnify:CR=1 FL=1
MFEHYSLSEIIRFLENKDYEKFIIADNYASVWSIDSMEIIIEAPDNIIPDKNAELTVKVLKNLDECVSKAHKWLEHFNIKKDRWYPNALDKGFEVNGIYTGSYDCGHYPSKTYGFTITFGCVNSYPCDFTVKFHENLWPFAVEEWVV